MAGDTVNYLIGPSRGGSSGCHGAAGGVKMRVLAVPPHGCCKEGAVPGLLWGAAPPSTIVAGCFPSRGTKTYF